MSEFLRQFTSSLKNPDQGADPGADQPDDGSATADSVAGPSSANQVLTAAGDQPAGSDNAPEQTDDSKLAAPGTVYVSPDGGTTDEPFPEPDVEYDFCANVVNLGKLPSGPFFVLFKLSGDQDWEMSFAQDAGLKAGASVLAVVHFGTFPNKFANYDLTACIFSDSAPDTPIRCAGSFGIVVNTK